MSGGAHNSKNRAQNKARINKSKTHDIIVSEGTMEAKLSKRAQQARTEVTDRSLDEILGSISGSLREQPQRPGRHER